MNNDFYIRNISNSQFANFIKNSGDWQNQRILGNYDNRRGVAPAVGTVAHKFVEAYLKTGNINEAVIHSNKCIYEGEDGNIYIIDIDNFDDHSNITLEKVLQDFKTNVVDFGKTGSIEQLRKQVEQARSFYVSEVIDYGEIL